MIRKTLSRQFLTVVLALFLVSNAPAQNPRETAGKAEFSVLDFGAVGDGKVNNTKAIQATIDACNAAGGGRVMLLKRQCVLRNSE